VFIVSAYTVGVLSLRQSGTFFFNGVQVFRALREKPAHRDRQSTMLPQVKRAVVMQNDATA